MSPWTILKSQIATSAYSSTLQVCGSTHLQKKVCISCCIRLLRINPANSRLQSLEWRMVASLPLIPPMTWPTHSHNLRDKNHSRYKRILVPWPFRMIHHYPHSSPVVPVTHRLLNISWVCQISKHLAGSLVAQAGFVKSLSGQSWNQFVLCTWPLLA